MVDRANRAVRQARTTGTQPPSQDRRCWTDRRTTRTSTAAPRERSQARLAAGDGDATALNSAAVLAILRRRKWILLASIVLCPLLAYVAITQLTPRYTATGTMIYDPSESTVREMQSILRVDPITDAVMATQAEVLHGMPVIEQVANRLNLLSNPEFNISLKPPSWPERRLAAIQRMLFGAERIRQPRCPGHGWSLPATPR